MASGLTPEPTPGVADIDWSAPWLADWRTVGEPLARRIVSGMAQPDALNLQAGTPVRFVPQADLPSDQAYEAFIFSTRCVRAKPCRGVGSDA